MNRLTLPPVTRRNIRRKPPLAVECPPALVAVALALVGFYAAALVLLFL